MANAKGGGTNNKSPRSVSTPRPSLNSRPSGGDGNSRMTAKTPREEKNPVQKVVRGVTGKGPVRGGR